MRIVPSRPSTQAQPAEGRPGPSDNNDDDDYENIDLRLSVSCNVCLAVWTHSGHRVRPKQYPYKKINYHFLVVMAIMMRVLTAVMTLVKMAEDFCSFQAHLGTA